MNKVILIGRLTKDPEIRSTGTGKKVAAFSIAVNDGKGPNGEDLTQYFDIDAWDKLADIVENYLKKGVRVAIVGSLRNRSWDAPDGSKRRATSITARELEILTSRSEMEHMGSNSSLQSPSPTSSQPDNSQQSGTESSTHQSQDDEVLPEIDIDEINIQMPF